MKITLDKNSDGQPLLVFHTETAREVLLLGEVRSKLGTSCSVCDHSDGTFSLNVQPSSLLQTLIKND